MSLQVKIKTPTLEQEAYRPHNQQGPKAQHHSGSLLANSGARPEDPLWGAIPMEKNLKLFVNLNEGISLVHKAS